MKATTKIIILGLFLAKFAIAGNGLFARSSDSGTVATKSLHTKPLPKVGDQVRIIDTVACPTNGDLERVQTLVGKKDTIAAEAYVAQQCIDLPGGIEFTIEDVSVGNDAFCGRSRDSTKCLWMSWEAVATGKGWPWAGANRQHR